MPDWFDQNAPKAAAAAPAADDWFASNAPPAARRPVSAEDFMPTPADDGIPWAQAWGRGLLGDIANSLDPKMVETVGDNVIGALKGAGHTAATLGSLFHKIPGVSKVVDAVYGDPGASQRSFAVAPEVLESKNTAQSIGRGIEQAAEYLLPGTAAEKGAAAIAGKIAPIVKNAPKALQVAARFVPGMVTEAAAASGVAAAQGADPTAAAAFGAGGSALSTGVKAAAPILKEQALKQVEQFLGPTKERYKAMAQRIAPEILKRGIRGGREGVLEQAAQQADVAGDAIDNAITQFGQRQVPAQAVSDALETAKDAFRTTREMTLQEAVKGGHATMNQGRLTLKQGAKVNAAGNVELPVVFEPRAVRQLDGLQKVMQELGPDPTVEQLIAVRRGWDSVVSQAGGYAHRAPGAIGMPLKDISEAWAKREGAGAIRKLLDQEVPELTTLNKEFSFWKNLDDVLTQTTQRTKPHGPGIGSQLAGVAGAAAGSGHGLGAAFATGKLAKLANDVFTSPRWRLASAQMKDRLATAIMNGSPTEVVAVLGRINAGAGAQAASSGQP